MKRAVSVSIGSSKRDKVVRVNILGETVQMERIGTDGDLKEAARLFSELDGKVDALGVGGGLLGLMVGERWYPMHSLQPLVHGVRQTPVVDGTGLKMTLEWKAVLDVDRQLKRHIQQRTALVMTAVDRWGMARGAQEAGYRCIYGDILYSLGLPIPVRREKAIHWLAATIAPIISRLPFTWVYPVGKSQEKRKPTHTRYFEQAGIILGDCHYIWKYMPERMDGKIIITNTTTPQDVAFFAQSGVKFLATTTPVYDGRSFGTNALEAAIIAASGRKERVDYAHPGNYFRWMTQMVEKLGLTAQIQELSQ